MATDLKQYDLFPARVRGQAREKYIRQSHGVSPLDPGLSRSFGIFPLLALLVVVAAFPAIPALADQPLESVDLQLKWKHAFQFAGYYAAVEKGYYRNAGLDVRIHEHQGVRSPVDTLLAGDVSFAVTDSSVLIHRSRGQPIVVLATIFQHSPYAFLVRADSGIRRVEDFRGRRVMLLDRDLQDAALIATLHRAGLKSGDFQRQHTSFDAMSLVRDETDVFNAYVTDQGFTLQQAGIEGRYLLPSQYGIDFYGDILVTTEDEILHHGPRVEAFLKASLQGWEYALSHPQELINLILERYNTQNLSREHLEYEASASRELIQPLLVNIGYTNPGRWEHIRDIFAEIGLIPKHAEIDGLLYKPPRQPPAWAVWIAVHWQSVLLSLILVLVLVLLIALLQMRRQIRLRTAELAASEQHWRALVETAPACVITLDPDGHLATINAAGVAMLGADSAEQLRDRKFEQWIDEPYRDAFNSLSRSVFSGHSGSLLFRATGPGGRVVLLETHAVPFLDSSGDIPHLLGITQDLTEKKNTEREQKRLQRELNQKHKMEALGQLCGGIAHDFNNILGVILGFSGLAATQARTEGYPTLVDHIDKIDAAGLRAKDLVAQLLTFSRSDSGELEIVQMNQLLLEEIRLMKAIMPASMAITPILENVSAVRANRVQIRQLVMNLCINARDAMEGSGTLSIHLRTVHLLESECSACHASIPGPWVELSFGDSGPGIEAQSRERLFEPFFTTKGVGKGTGMGLAVVHGILSRLQGHIIVENRVAGGASFRVLLPPCESDRGRSQVGSGSADTPLHGNRQHILVVDDEPEILEFVRILLTANNYRVTTETRAHRAISIYRRSPDDFSLVITDQTMPGLSGIDLIRTIRSIRPECPMILCTGFSENVNEERATRMNIHYLKKPVDSFELLKLIAGILNLSSWKIA